MKARVKHWGGWYTVPPLRSGQYDFKLPSTAVHLVALGGSCRLVALLLTIELMRLRHEQSLLKLHHCAVITSSIVENIKKKLCCWRKIPKRGMTTSHLGKTDSSRCWFIKPTSGLWVWCQSRSPSLWSVFVFLWGCVRLWWLIHGNRAPVDGE